MEVILCYFGLKFNSVSTIEKDMRNFNEVRFYNGVNKPKQDRFSMSQRQRD